MGAGNIKDRFISSLIEAFVLDLQHRNIRQAFTGRQALLVESHYIHRVSLMLDVINPRHWSLYCLILCNFLKLLFKLDKRNEDI